MLTDGFWVAYGEAAKTAIGFFWKAGWAFVMGYAVSAVIQAFVPKARLTERMGSPDLRSVSLATIFGAISSSCSFAALATARSLVAKGAHFIAAVAFMFASTNLVIELGVLILIFLGPKFLVAELVGGIILITVSTLLMRGWYPTAWFESAKQKVESEAGETEEDFDWRRRIKSRAGWSMVGSAFVGDWKMVWEEILIGFTVAGFVAVLVPTSFWETIFLHGADLPDWLVSLENAVVAPFVAAATFIGSMGNIPLAAVLHQDNVVFAGIMGFIYSDLMVPPLVRVNAKYYGWKPALYIAGVMFVAIVITALLLSGLLGLFAWAPSGQGQSSVQLTQFGFDYTFYFNVLAAGVTLVLVGLHRRRQRERSGAHQGHGHHHHHHSGVTVKRAIVYFCILVLAGGVVAYFLTH